MSENPQIIDVISSQKTDELQPKVIELDYVNKDSYTDKYVDHVFEQYKLYLEMADRISARRQAANTYFLTVNTGLVALTGFAKTVMATDLYYYLLTSIAGIVLCYVWYRLVLSYKNLNSAKFKVVHLIERKLPLKLYDAEWDAVGRGKNKDLYNPFTNLEMKVPWIFIMIYLVVIASVIPWSKL